MPIHVARPVSVAAIRAVVAMTTDPTVLGTGRAPVENVRALRAPNDDARMSGTAKNAVVVATGRASEPALAAAPALRHGDRKVTAVRRRETIAEVVAGATLIHAPDVTVGRTIAVMVAPVTVARLVTFAARRRMAEGVETPHGADRVTVLARHAALEVVTVDTAVATNVLRREVEDSEKPRPAVGVRELVVIEAATNVRQSAQCARASDGHPLVLRPRVSAHQVRRKRVRKGD